MFEINGKYTNAKVMIDNLEEGAIKQISSFVNHPAFTNSIAIMPDAHQGKGSCIGFTMPMNDKVIANIIGVDIGCGMLSINIGKTLPASFEVMDRKIRKVVPFGINVHERNDHVIHFKNDFPWRKVSALAHNFSIAYNEKFGTHFYAPAYDMDNYFLDLCSRIGMDIGRAIDSIGTLGGGNHFVELGISTSGDYWLTIHTGSRNIGKRVCDYWQHMASKVVKAEKQKVLDERIKEIRTKYSGMEIKNKIKEARNSMGFDAIISDELQYLEGENAFGYLKDMIFCQQYASTNREYIAKLICEGLDIKTIDTIETVHNYINFRDCIVRKGSISSYIGERMIIPFNMRDGILICEGKSNPDWNFSAPHGAGRLMSRSQAKKNVNLDDFKKSMEGIFSTSVGKGTLDESPMAYKDAKIIEEAIGPTATIIDRIKPVMNLKDGEGSDTD
jgi:RNA-splicing ligase RtcB